MISRVILGLAQWISFVSEEGKKVEVFGRVDTGATCSSIDITLACKLKRTLLERRKKIKSASGTSMREAVRLEVEIGGKLVEGNFTLADRSHMTYPVLIGQNILRKGNFLIDPLLKEVKP